jgi:Flp pilus assembly protein TadD
LIAVCALLLLAAGVDATSPANDDRLVSAIANAIDKGRLTQAHEMLGRMSVAPSEDARRTAAPLSAKLALAERQDAVALSLYQKLLVDAPEDCALNQGTGIAAVRLGRISFGLARLEVAARLCPDQWKTWNALGVAYDLEQNWSGSGRAYASARVLAPGNAAVLNNAGYSLVLQRRFAEAATLLSDAARRAPTDKRIANNLDIAVVAAGDALAPSSRSVDQESARLNNAGYAAYIAGRPDEARTYFDQAMQSSGAWFPRAAANRALLGEGAHNDH